MGIEQFPEIETFQKLPRKVIVKGGSAGFDSKGKSQLRGIVINNAGHPIRNAKVSLVIFDEHEIPILNKSTLPDPEALPQGGIASFTFTLDDYEQEIKNYYLYVNWKYDDSNW
ncbi:MAG: hypothetical protein HY588_02235 [Candidatus Omnitrophica bacterium]|nr:hypothetical protein [Candidatus Omnitrophota bacterium]